MFVSALTITPRYNYEGHSPDRVPSVGCAPLDDTGKEHLVSITTNIFKLGEGVSPSGPRPTLSAMASNKIVGGTIAEKR